MHIEQKTFEVFIRNGACTKSGFEKSPLQYAEVLCIL